MNFVSDRAFVARLDGALKPHDRLIYPIIVTRGIGLSLLATGRSLGQTLFPLVHHLRLGLSQASVTVLSMICR